MWQKPLPIAWRPFNLRLVTWEDNDKKKNNSEWTLNEFLEMVLDYTRLKAMEEDAGIVD